MPSPFPGMNPYLEQDDAWHDFHTGFPQVARAFLEPQVGANYVVKVDEITFIHELPAQQRLLMGRPDVFLSSLTPANQPSTTTQTLPGTMRVRLSAVDVERHLFLEIRDRFRREVITVIELLSPSNKAPGPDRELYLAKRRQILNSRSHFVEIDLLRGWQRMPEIQLGSEFAYCVLLSRVELRPEAEVVPLRLRDPLPDIRIPLRNPDPDIVLPLQQVLHRLYDESGYRKYIYANPPYPSLSADELAWARTIVPNLP
jgi:hypothetical protein